MQIPAYTGAGTAHCRAANYAEAGQCALRGMGATLLGYQARMWRTVNIT